MSEPVLTFLKFCLLAVLYLFLARVVWIVAREMRGTPVPSGAPSRSRPSAAALGARRKQWRLVLVEPAAEAGATFPIDDEVTLGRGGGCTMPLAFDTFVSQVHARAFDRDGTSGSKTSARATARSSTAARARGRAGRQGRAVAGRRDRARGRPVRLATGSATDTGLVRSNNEDSFLVDDEHVLFAVADGMGGHRGGEVASRTAIEALRAAIAAGRPVNDAIVRANNAVIDAPSATRSSPAWARP